LSHSGHTSCRAVGVKSTHGSSSASMLERLCKKRFCQHNLLNTTARRLLGIAPCRSGYVYRRFGGTWCYLHQSAIPTMNMNPP
jgi:hypothetical protein